MDRERDTVTSVKTLFFIIINTGTLLCVLADTHIFIGSTEETWLDFLSVNTATPPHSQTTTAVSGQAGDGGMRESMSWERERQDGGGQQADAFNPGSSTPQDGNTVSPPLSENAGAGSSSRTEGSDITGGPGAANKCDPSVNGKADSG